MVKTHLSRTLQLFQIATVKRNTMHTVRVKQTYWLDEESEIKLQQLGAVLIDEVIVKDDYYDNDTFDLATNQIWLSQRDLQWQLIIALPKSNINGDGGKQGEQNSLVPKSEATTKSRSQHRDGPSSEERYGSSPRLRSRNSEGGASGKQNKVVGEGNPLQEHKTATDPEQWDKTTSTDVHDKAEPRYNELRAHRQIIEYIAQFLQIPLSKEEGGDMTLSHFLQLAKIHHYASCHTAKRRTYKLKDTCRIVIEKDELMPRCLAIMSINADVLNIINELEKMEEIAAHLRMDPCQTDPILA